MQIIGTLSLSGHVTDWLGNSSHPRILHVFDRACNLINENREILSIVTPHIGNGPFNLVVEREIVFSEYLNVETPISILDIRLTLGDLIIEPANAQVWSPCPDWEKLYNNRAFIADQFAGLSIPDSQFSSSLNSAFCSALARADISSAKNIASKLAGLGIGLTPSGDDFMMGALYAAWILHPPEVAIKLAQEIANAAAPLTTSLSTEWLRSAARGEAGILWHQLFEAFVPLDVEQLRSVTADILAVGATSGVDALAGFTSTFIVYRELEKKYVVSKFI